MTTRSRKPVQSPPVERICDTCHLAMHPNRPEPTCAECAYQARVKRRAA